eukprot:1623401-Prymnesium_polylepis.2
MWNGLVSSFANEMTAAEEEAAQAAKEAAAREHQEMLDRYRNSGPTTGGSSTKRKPTQPKRKAKKEASKDAKKDVKKEEAQDAVVGDDEMGSYDRLASIRSNLALALRRCQKELSKQVRASGKAPADSAPCDPSRPSYPLLPDDLFTLLGASHQACALHQLSPRRVRALRRAGA